VRRRILIPAAVLVWSLWPGPVAHAVPFSFSFTGEITDVDHILTLALNPGDVFSGTYTFDSGHYSVAIRLTATASDYGLAATGGQIATNSDTSGVRDLYAGYGLPPVLIGVSIIGPSPWFLLLDVEQQSQTVFSGAPQYPSFMSALTTLNPADFDSANVSLVFRGPYGDLYGADGSITGLQGGEVQGVPAPAPLLLCATGLAALCLRRSARGVLHLLAR